MPDPRDPGNANRLLLAAAIGLAIFLVAGALFAQALPAGAQLDPAEALERSQRALGNPVGDYTLFDEDGRPVRLAAWRGVPLVVTFVYTGCGQVCPTTIRFVDRAVGEAQRALGPGAFRVVTVGFNLPFDTPAAMRDFRRRQGVTRPGWQFLAGDGATIEGLARDTGFVWAPTAAGFDHLTQATIVDGRGRVHRQVYGESFELPMFVGPLKELVTGQESGGQDLAGLIEKVRILCTVYDPRAGRYRLDYGLLIEILAGASMLVATAWYLIAGARGRRSRTV